MTEYISKNDSEVALAGASRACNLNLVKSLLAGRAAVNGVIASADRTDADSLRPLFFACLAGQLPIMRQLVEHRAIVHGELASLLFYRWQLKEEQRMKVARELITMRADVNSVDADGVRPLSAAVSTGWVDLTQELIACNADLNLVTAEELFHTACSYGHVDLMQMFWDYGSSRSPDSASLVRAIRCASCADVILKLVELRANVNSKDSEGLSALHHAAHTRSTDVTLKLVELRADLNSADPEGLSALHHAVRWRNTDVILKLVELKANMDSKDPEGLTALHNAARGGSTDVVQCLIDLRAAVQCHAHLDGFCHSPLWLACDGGHQDVVKRLLQCSRNDVQTAFWTAVTSWNHLTYGRRDVLVLLVQEGANMNARDSPCGWTPLQWACFHLNVEVAQALLNLRATVNFLDMDGQSPLHYASCQAHAELVAVLLAHRAEATRDRFGHTPLDLAQARAWAGAVEAHQRQAELVRLLLCDGHVELVYMLFARRAGAPRITRDRREKFLHTAVDLAWAWAWEGHQRCANTVGLLLDTGSCALALESLAFWSQLTPNTAIDSLWGPPQKDPEFMEIPSFTW